MHPEPAIPQDPWSECLIQKKSFKKGAKAIRPPRFSAEPPRFHNPFIPLRRRGKPVDQL